jgi:23S rRNA pseudouridine1911/1915/1917 synthase
MIDDKKDDFEEELDDQDVTELHEHYKFIADKGQSLLRIDKFLMNRIENASRTKIQEAAQAGNIFVNDRKETKANYQVKPNDIITIMMSQPPREIEIIPQDIPIDIVYEDDELLIINKKPGMVVHPGHGNYTGTLVNALAFHLQGMPLFNSKDPRPGLVHRIDKDTSGLMVVAKTEYAKVQLARQFFDKTSTRTYQAIVWGTPEPPNGRIEGNIGRSLKDRLQMTVYSDPEIGKTAVTHYKTLESFGYITLVECKLETGRTHQIRVHMKHIGHPLLNDERYGGHEILKGTTFTKYKQFINNCFNILPRQALHAKTLGFIHPKTNEYMSFDSDLPDDMVNVLEKWRQYTLNREL